MWPPPSKSHSFGTTGHKLRGTITPYIGNLTFLRVTDLGNNSFYGKIPKEVGHLF